MKIDEIIVLINKRIDELVVKREDFRAGKKWVNAQKEDAIILELLKLKAEISGKPLEFKDKVGGSKKWTKKILKKLLR